MAEREIFWADDATRSTTTSTTFQTKVSLTWQPKASTDYLVLWGCTLDCSTAATVSARLHNVTLTDSYQAQGRTNSATDRVPACGMTKVSFGLAPPSQTWRVEYNTGSGTNTAGVQDAWIMVLELVAEDAVVYTAGTTSTTSTTYVDTSTEAAFTPSTAGDYLILANAHCNSPTAAQLDVRLWDGTTAYGEVPAFSGHNSSSYLGVGTIVKKTLAASAQSWKLQLRSRNGVSNSALREKCIAAIRLDKGFTRQTYAESRARATTTSLSMVDKLTASFDALNASTYVFACGVIDLLTGSAQCSHDLQDNGVTVGAALVRTFGSGHAGAFFRVYRDTPAARAQAWKTRYMAVTADTIGFAESAIASLAVGGGALRLGGVVPDALMLGGNHVDRLYLGANQIWGF